MPNHDLNQLLNGDTMPEKPYKVALLGAGYIADWHARALATVPDTELIAVCDLSSRRAEALAAAHGIPHAETSLQEMLDKHSPDVVHVLVPPEHHIATSRQVLEAGAHVFLEKPMGVSGRECSELAELARARGLGLGVSHNFLFWNVYEQLKQNIGDGVLGRIEHVTITWNKELGQVRGGPFNIWMLSEPENLMLEIGAHSVAHMLDLAGKPKDLAVTALSPADLPNGRRVYRRWLATAFTGFAAIDLRFSFLPGYAEHSVHVRGSLASATVDFERNTYALHRHTKHDPDIDRYLMIAGEAKSLRRQARRNIANYVLSKFQLSKQGNSFETSIARSMAVFYSQLPDVTDSRLTGEFGADVIELCCELGRRAGVQQNPVQVSVPADTPVPQPDVLVLGGSGFIGRHLVRQLVDTGRSVRLMTRNPEGLAADLRRPEIEAFRGDMRNRGDIERALDGVSVVFHLARGFCKTWDEYVRDDVQPTQMIGEACIASGVKRLIYTGTIDSYYAGSAGDVITDGTPLDPKIDCRNSYARAKAAGEDALLKLHAEQGLPVVILRPGIVIGSGGSPFHWGVGMWPDTSVCQIWGEGNNKLPLVLVQDVVSALVAAMDTGGIDGETFLLVDRPCLSANEYLDELERCTGSRFQRIPTPIWRFYLFDMFKYAVKCLVRHPGRKMPSYRDWNSRRQLSAFDSPRAREVLNWRPASSREAIIEQGIAVPAAEMLR